ncbi:hypothetical protein [Rodentibacter haemolyticus]|uniref:Uncharacterized protein n=1 Tax=Rodentibacter haemolyticus TaxID=2778911 RepID=A0ABX6UUX9_9PAST|nr:hypothetical protein [Rodentibacter haemolyticus]QPB41638.1 hypothetical protein IHV77_06735 [Rodentibacter haemolyticus]
MKVNGGALDTYEGTFEKTIENLMIYIILRAGRNPYGHKIALNDIDKILSEHSLNELIACLEEEKQEFLYDLNLVLNKKETTKQWCRSGSRCCYRCSNGRLRLCARRHLPMRSYKLSTKKSPLHNFRGIFVTKDFRIFVGYQLYRYVNCTL